MVPFTYTHALLNVKLGNDMYVLKMLLIICKGINFGFWSPGVPAQTESSFFG